MSCSPFVLCPRTHLLDIFFYGEISPLWSA